MPIYVSRKNPRLTLEELRELGYGGKDIKEVLRKVKKHYPKARRVK